MAVALAVQTAGLAGEPLRLAPLAALKASLSPEEPPAGPPDLAQLPPGSPLAQPRAAAGLGAPPGLPYRMRSNRVMMIRPGDLLDIEIVGEPTLSGQFPVTSDGNVKLPEFLGVLKAAGVDTIRLAAMVAERGKKYLVQPTVVVNVVGRTPAMVNVLGEVTRQGAYDYEETPNLLALLAACGGVVATGDATKIVIVRQGKELPVFTAGAPGPDAIPPDVPLQEGDTVVVPRRHLEMVTVTGAVQRPSYISLEQAPTCTRALILVGGASLGASLERSYILRGAERIPVNLLGLLSGAKEAGEDVPLRDKDVLVVPTESGGGLGMPELVIIAGAVLRPAVIPLAQAKTVERAVMLAGGLAEGANPEASYILRGGKCVDVDVRAIQKHEGTPDLALQPNDLLVVPALPRDMVYVVGAVALPGPKYMLWADTLIKALVVAGGATPVADQKAAYILRQGKRIEVGAADILGASTTVDAPLQPNDLVVIPPKTVEKYAAEQWAQTVAVAGAVGRPGLLGAAQANSVMRALILAGGPAPLADLKNAYILRQTQRAPVDAETALNGKGPDPPLAPGDMLVIPEMSRLPVFVLGGVVRPGILAAQIARSVSKAVALCGGVTYQGDAEHAYIVRAGRRLMVDIKAIIDGTAPDIELESEDLLTVPEKPLEMVYVSGAVVRPGPQLRATSGTLLKALTLAMAVPQSDVTHVQILRGSRRLEVDADKVLHGTVQDVELQANDLVIVPLTDPLEQAALQAVRTVGVVGAVMRPGLYSPQLAPTVARIMAWVGGPLQYADLEHAYLLRDKKLQTLNLLAPRAGGEMPDGGTELRAGDLLVIPFLTAENLAAQQLAQNVLVIGGVVRPGMVLYREAPTAGRALLLAGGAAEGGDLIGAYILRGQTRLEVNLQAVADGKGKDVDLQARDILVVPTVSRETVHVAGAVLKPGPFYRYYADTVGRALDMAGGALPLADLAGAYVLRKGERVAVKLAAPAPPGPEGLGFRLEPNDVLIVPTRATELVYVAGAVQKPGSVPLQQAATGATAVVWAGGALPNAKLEGAYVLRNGQRLPLDLSAVGRNERDKDVTLACEDVVIVPPVDLDPVYVVGSVKSPGGQPVTLASTAAKALLMAGGPIEDVADLKAAYVLRESERIPVDLDAVTRVGKTSEDLPLKAHDALVIPKREDRFNVVGEVFKPGPYSLLQADTVLGAMSLAGPALPTADLGACTLLRRGQSIPVDLDAMMMDKSYGLNQPLEGGDTLVVPRQKARVFVFGAVALPGAYPFTKRDTYVDLIAKAGGAGPEARINRIEIYRARSPEEILRNPQPPPKDRDALVRSKFSVMELIKLDPKSPVAQPRDGDVIYVPGPRTGGFDIVGFLANLVTVGWLFNRP